jgi:hypothetical protein
MITAITLYILAKIKPEGAIVVISFFMSPFLAVLLDLKILSL